MHTSKRDKEIQSEGVEPTSFRSGIDMIFFRSQGSVPLKKSSPFRVSGYLKACPLGSNLPKLSMNLVTSSLGLGHS